MSSRRIAIQLEQVALDLHDLLGAGRLRPGLGDDAGLVVVVAEVIGRDRAFADQPLGRDVDVVGELVHAVPRISSMRSTPSTRTARIHVRWFSPTCSSSTRSGSTPKRFANLRWKPIATLHRPMLRCPASESAWLTIPTGFVKSTIHASGAPIGGPPLRRARGRRAPSAAPWRTRRLRPSPGRADRTVAAASRRRGGRPDLRSGAGSGRSRRRRSRRRGRSSRSGARSSPAWRASAARGRRRSRDAAHRYRGGRSRRR